MILSALYCSYKGSGAGYQMSLADPQKNTLTSLISDRNCIPETIRRYFSNGGANAICGYDDRNRIYFMMMKRLDLEDDTKRFDEMGRMVYINIAFFSSDKNEMTAFANGFFGQFNAIKKSFAGLLLFDDGELGYQINFDVLKQVITSSCAFGNTADCRKIFMYSDDILSFVSVEAGWDYFAKMCKVPLDAKPRLMAESSQLLQLLSGSSGQLFAEPAPSDVQRVSYFIPVIQRSRSETSVPVESQVRIEPETQLQAEPQIQVEPKSQLQAEPQVRVEPKSQFQAKSQVRVEPKSQFQAKSQVRIEPKPHSQQTRISQDSEDAVGREIKRIRQELYEAGVKLRALEDRFQDSSKTQKDEISKWRMLAISAMITASVAGVLSIISLILSIIR